MDIKEKIEKSAATVRQMSVLAGIPDERIYKWKQGKGTPDADDLKKMQAMFQFISNLSKEQIKSEVAKKKTGDSDSEADDDLIKGIKLSENKEVITLGKQVYKRLRPDEYNEAFKDWPGVPMFNVPVTASFVESYRDQSAFHPQYYLHDPRFKDCSFGAIITGDSMYAEIRHGDFVVCQEIVDKDFVVYGDIYYIVSTNGLETCKYLNADPKNDDNYLLVPRNESISPSPLPKKMVQRLFKVRGVLRGY